jgi:hypothetical protein
MSFEPTDHETTRPTTEVQPLVPIQPDETPSTRETKRRTDAEPERPRRTDYATRFTRHREEITPGVARLD